MVVVRGWLLIQGSEVWCGLYRRYRRDEDIDVDSWNVVHVKSHGGVSDAHAEPTAGTAPSPSCSVDEVSENGPPAKRLHLSVIATVKRRTLAGQEVRNMLLHHGDDCRRIVMCRTSWIDVKIMFASDGDEQREPPRPAPTRQ